MVERTGTAVVTCQVSWYGNTMSTTDTDMKTVREWWMRAAVEIFDAIDLAVESGAPIGTYPVNVRIELRKWDWA